MGNKMRCSYCGKELPVGVSFCDGCGAKIDNQQMMPNQNQMPNYENPNINYYNQNYPNQMYYNYGNYQSPKKNNGITILIIIVALLAVSGVFGTWLYFKYDGKSNKENQETSENDQDYEDYDDYDDYDNDDNDNNQTSNQTLNVGNYVVNIPSGYKYVGSVSGGTVIVGGKTEMGIVPFPAPIETLVVRKDEFISQMQQTGNNITSFNLKTINGKQVLFMESNTSGLKIVVIGGNVSSNESFLISIGNVDGSFIAESTYDLAVEIINSAKKA